MMIGWWPRERQESKIRRDQCKEDMALRVSSVMEKWKTGPWTR